MPVAQLSKKPPEPYAGTMDTLKEIFLAPARGMSATPSHNLDALGIWGKIHKAIDPVQAFGGYGNIAAMALPGGTPGRALARYGEGGRFLHGTTKDAAKSIKSAGGLEPKAGAFVENAYGGEYAAVGADLPKAVYMAGQGEASKAVNAVRAQVGFKLNKRYHSVTDADIKQHGALVIARPGRGDAFKLRENQKGRNLEGKETYDYALAEPGDWYSFDDVPISGVMTGERLLAFIKKHGGK